MSKFFFLLLSAGIFCMACSKTGNREIIPPPVTPPATDTATHVSALTPSVNAALLLPGGSQQISIAFTPANAGNKTLLWSSSDTAIAKVDDNGRVTAGAAGSVIITAASADNAAVKTAVAFTVLKNYDVFAAGNDGSFAYLWKNGVASQLVGGLDVGRSANAMVMAGNDTYIAGITILFCCNRSF